MSTKNVFFIFFGIIILYIIIKFNFIFIQSINAGYLIKTNQSARIFPHRVNSIGKLHDIWRDGFRSFEVDIIYNDHSGSFQVGHDKPGSINLENLLLSIDYINIQRIWLDMKIITNHNYMGIIKRLEYLNDKYYIKDKVILEFGMTLPLIKIFSENGWHTSYYLPTNEILKYLNHNDKKSLINIASQTARQSKEQKLSAISFDIRLNTFVRKYLEPLISSDIVYHTWLGPKLRSINFQSKLLNNNLYSNKRVKTILIPYKSVYDR